MFVSGAAVLCFLLLGALFLFDNFFSNYIGICVAIGIIVISVIAICYMIKNSISYITKGKHKVFGIISLIIIIISAVIGFKYKAYLNHYKLEYSSILSIFVMPLIPCAILNIIRDQIDENIENTTIAGIFFLLFIFLLSVTISLIVTGIASFNEHGEFLDAIKRQIKYVDRSDIEFRKRKYGTDDYKEIIPKMLEDYQKNENIPASEVIDSILNSKSTVDNYKLKTYYYDKIDSYITCVFVDKTEYGRFGEYKKFYVKLDKSNLNVIDYPSHHYDITDPEDEKFISYMESTNNGTGKYKEFSSWPNGRRKYSSSNVIKYALIYLKNMNGEINTKTLNDQIDYIYKSDNESYSVDDEDGKLTIIYKDDGYYYSSNQYEVDPVTYKFN